MQILGYQEEGLKISKLKNSGIEIIGVKNLGLKIWGYENQGLKILGLRNLGFKLGFRNFRACLYTHEKFDGLRNFFLNNLKWFLWKCKKDVGQPVFSLHVGEPSF